MKDEFNELLASIREGGAILCGEAQPSAHSTSSRWISSRSAQSADPAAVRRADRHQPCHSNGSRDGASPRGQRWCCCASPQSTPKLFGMRF